MISGKKLIDDVWNVRIYKVEDASYKSIEFNNKIFPYWVISYIQDGQVEVTHGNVVQIASSGQVMIHAPGLPFGERSNTPGRHLWILLEITNSYQLELFQAYPINEIVTLSDPEEFTRLFYILLEAWNRQVSLFSELALAGIGMQLMYLLLDNWDRTGRIRRTLHDKKGDERLDKVLIYLNKHLDAKITRKNLAELVHLNPNYLDKIFQQKFQIKPMQMLRELRLKEAKRMLESSGCSLSEISARCGLGDSSYLSHQFHKRFGLTPGQYRDQVRQVHQSYYRMDT